MYSTGFYKYIIMKKADCADNVTVYFCSFAAEYFKYRKEEIVYMKKKWNIDIPKGFIIVFVFFAILVITLYFGFIRKSSELHSGDSDILQSDETKDILGDNAVTNTPEIAEATPAPEIVKKISALSTAETADVIFLAVEGENKSECSFMAFTRSGSGWSLALETSGFIGKNGVNYSQRSEGDYTTPGGVYPMKECFGIMNAPDHMSLKYTKVTKEHYWDGDRTSSHYNTMVEAGRMPAGWNKGAGEHLIEYTQQYRYCMNIGFNCDPPVPGVGFAIFLHCTREGMTNTGGCIAIPESYMIKCLEMATENTYIVILKDIDDIG